MIKNNMGSRITFDVFFSMLKKEGKVKDHHKEALKIFMEQKLGKLVATKKEFDEIYKLY